MRILLIETATERGMCACYEGEQELFTLKLPFGLQQGQQLLAELEKTLKNEEIALETVEALAVGIGPGSYTGIRIAATIGKMLSFGLKIPLVGVPTLEAFEPENEGPFAVLLDAKIGGVYLQLGEKRGKDVLFSTAPQVISVEKALPCLTGRTALSPNCNPLKVKLPHQGPWEEAAPSPRLMAGRANQLLQEKKGVTNGTLDLLYLRS